MWTTNDIPDQTGKTVLITGANSGIGFETARALYQAGAHVIVACRNEEKASQTLFQLQQQSARGTLETGILELSDLQAVTKFAHSIRQNHGQLHILINNAGVAAPPASKTVQGYERQFGVNFLGHFAFTGCLYFLLNTTPGARVVTVSSNGYQQAVIDFTNLHSEQGYDALREYRQSKLANLLFSIELQRRIDANGDSVQSIAAQPGANNTALTRYLSEEAVAAGTARLGTFMEPWQGALSVLYAAVSANANGGHLYEPEDGGYRGYPAQSSIQANALDEQTAQQLWHFAEQATGIYYPTKFSESKS